MASKRQLKLKVPFERMETLVGQTGVRGSWADVAGGQKQFRTEQDAVLNWWPGTGTLTFQGPQPARGNLERLVCSAIEELVKPGTATIEQTTPHRRQIFVVHGHDGPSREQLELVLHRLGLEPFVLANTAGDGRTIIEALEQHIGKEGQSDFGIVLLTPDDMGYAKKDGEKEVKARARQNVILEMGMLLSSLTRERVAILIKGFVELPSDISGVIYINFNDHVKETVPKLSERLQKCGISLTPEQVSRASA